MKSPEPNPVDMRVLNRDRAVFLEPADLPRGVLHGQRKTEAKSAQHVLISIPSGFQLRQFVHSRVVDLFIEKGIKVSLLSPNSHDEEIISSYPRGTVQIIPLEVCFGPLRRRYWAARQHLLL